MERLLLEVMQTRARSEASVHPIHCQGVRDGYQDILTTSKHSKQEESDRPLSQLISLVTCNFIHANGSSKLYVTWLPAGDLT